MTAYRNNAPTMTPDEVALWEQRITSGRLFSGPSARRGTLTDVVSHGTYYGYVQGCSCGPCLEAKRQYQRDYRARKQANVHA